MPGLLMGSDVVTEEETMQKANEAATMHGWDVDRYAHPELSLHGDDWELFYHGKSGQPGDFFLVIVKGRTGAVKLHGGY